MGVVDFLDVGFGDARWPTFNVADMAVSVGAVMLAWVLWQEDRVTLSRETSVPGLTASSPTPSVSVATAAEPGDLI
jgi:signal peptidase II